ncbi:ABC transporter G family member 22-like [Cornus florida]|uniref:ABC transporter G family member 22-like n=1 Tax=Cornus florida TaxID=4283 RepID=UPI00289CE63C|nr:ABC transporter G family member 22-like [Cornus florida]
MHFLTQMEIKKEFKGKYSDKIHGNMVEAASTAVIAPATTTTTSKEESDISIQKMPSLDLKRVSPSGKTIRKTKSLSAQFLVNIDHLIDNMTCSFDETAGPIVGRAPTDELGFFSVAASSFPSNDISDVMRLQNENHEDSAMDQSSPVDEEYQDSQSWRKLHIEPTLPIYLKFQDVKYKVAVKEENQYAEKSILHGITGSARPGEVLALMGPSGGGKTTLLNLLSGRDKVNGGIITYNDQPYTKSLKQRIGFVLQDDIVFQHLTVKETLAYAALLRLPNTLTTEQKKERAIDVISELGLERCQNTIIGGEFVRGISGGERKRVCIGNEILLNPSLLFLDEPTSGLDSTTALRIIEMLHNIAEAGKTVVTTIHQPSSRLFTKFDKLILLGKGSSLYSGKAADAMFYFSSIGCSPLIAMNPAEFLIDLANGNIKDKSVPSGLEDKLLPSAQKSEIKHRRPSPFDVHEYLIAAFEERVTNVEKTNKLLKPVRINGYVPETREWLNSRDLGATWWEQFSILFRRGLKERRHEYLSSVRVTQVISTAIIVGLLWWHSDALSPKQLHDQARLLYFISVFWAFFPLFTAIFTFPQERAMLAKERSVDMYRLSAYVIARNTSDLPLDLILPIVFLAIVYFMVGLKHSFAAFSLTLLTIFLSIIAAQGLGLTIGAAFMDVKKATTLASITVMTFMLSGGFFIQSVPSFMSWVRYISLNYHTYRLLLKIQYSCSGSGSGLDSCESLFIRGQRLDEGGAEVGALLVMIMGYRMLAYIFLRRMKLRTMT